MKIYLDKERCVLYDQNIAETRLKARKKRICEIWRERREGLMVPFQKIAEACKSTGLSQYYLRQGCKNGTVPHIKSGGVYYVNVPALMEELDRKRK